MSETPPERTESQEPAPAEQFIGALLDLTNKLQTTLDQMEDVIEFQRQELGAMAERLTVIEGKLDIEPPAETED